MLLKLIKKQKYNQANFSIAKAQVRQSVTVFRSPVRAALVTKRLYILIIKP